MNAHEAKCLICDKEQLVETYGDFVCKGCGQPYQYDEGHCISLSEEQIKLLRSSAMAAGTKGAEG
jgi:hypothetical protein